MTPFRYFIPEVLFEGNSPYNGDVKIVRLLGCYKLIVNGMVQSCSSHSRYAKTKVWGAMAKIIKARKDIKTVLLLGMGAGTLLKLLHQDNECGLSTTGVEIDPLIIELAKKYFELDTIANNKVIQADAYDVIADPRVHEIDAPFDCVVVDIYCGSDFPVKLTSQHFYQSVANLVAENGYLIVNRIVNKNDRAALGEVQDLINRYFEVIKVVKVRSPVISDNYIVLSRKTRPIDTIGLLA